MLIRILTFVSFVCSISLQLSAQDQQSTLYCAQAALHQDKIQNDETYRNTHHMLERLVYKWHKQQDQRNAAPYILPLVVHIVHNNGPENISDAQVQTAIQHLNDAFANVGYYNPTTGVNTQISFCLARRDPSGNATNGINRVQSPLTNFNYNVDDQTVKDLSRWNPLEYINVWVVNDICNNNSCGVAGYAYLPGAHGASFDGIVVEANWMGSTPSNSTVLAHEMGHYLGLYHTFEGGCDNDNCQLNGDRVCDTPPDNTTARPSCPNEINSCTSDEDDLSANNPFRPIALGGMGDQPDMKENYMDYSRFQCYDRFTQGQTNRMHGVIENIRHSLLESPACLDPCPVSFEVDFSPSAISAPVGTTVIFTNNSTADSYEWLLDGSLFSTDTNTAFTFNNEGSYQVTLTAFSNQNNCLPKDSTITIDVFCPVDASITASDSEVLAGATVSFTNTSLNATSYSWLVNGAIVSNDFEYTLNTTAPGFFNICLQASNGLCEDTQCTFVQANAVAVTSDDCQDTYLHTMGSPEFSEEGRCIVPATDGGFYIGGSRNGESLIIKIDDNENVVWERVFSFSGATGPEEKVFHLLEDGPFLVGTTWLGQTSQDHYLFKYNYDTDNFVWLRRISNSSYNRTFDIINLPGTPHYTLIGDRHENDTYGCDMTYLEIDKNAGTLLTSRRFSLGSCEVGVDAVLYDNQIFITGRYNAFGGGSNGMRPAITSLTLNGMENWTRLHLINTNTDARLYSREIIEDDGFLVVCGMGDIDGTSTIDQESFIYKTDSNGEMIWATIIDVPEGNREVLKSVVEQEDGYLAFGQFTPVNGGPRKMLLVKVDKAGNLSWSKTLEDNLDFLAPQKNGATHSNGFSYLLATQNDGSDSDIALLKISNTGELASDCVELRNLNVEAWQLPNPFDGLFDLTIQNYNPENAAGQSATSAVDLPIDTVCHTPCGEICANGEDDDNDGLIDCDDDDCPCFVDCGNTFVKALGKPQNDESLATILQSSDGFLYAGGSSEDAGLILKLSTEGEILSQLTFDFTPRQDRILSMIEDSEGYIVGAGFGQSMSSNERIGFIFKYDPVSESIIWSNSFSERAGFWTVNINPANGNYLAAGAWTVAGQNAVIAEFDRNNGSLNWTNEIDVGLSEAYYGIVPVGNILYLPNRFTMFTFADEMKAGITALDGNGNHQWSKYYLTPQGQPARQYSFGMVQDDGGLITSYIGDPNGGSLANSKSGLIRTDYAGNLEWSTEYDVAGMNSELSGYGLAKTPDGFLLYGYSSAGGDEDVVIIKTDKSGNALWARKYGGLQEDDILFNADNQLLQAGDYIYIIGRSRYFDGNEDAIIIKANASDGSVNANDCVYTELLDVSTAFLPDFESNQDVDQNVFTDLVNQVSTPPANAIDLTCENICMGSNLDLTAIIDTAYCNGDSLAMELRICNEGTDTLTSGTPFTVYDGNPTANISASILGRFNIPVPIPSGGCFNTVIALPYPDSTIYLIANEDGSLPLPFDLEHDFPVTPMIECDYTNNLDSTNYDRPMPDINLGPDTTICENGVFLLNAGTGFVSYQWQDGSIGQTYTAFEAGTYWVTGITACGDITSDTINIVLNNDVSITLGPDTIICTGETLTLSTLSNSGYTYQWTPSANLDCNNCPTVIATPDTTTTYEVAVSNSSGCVSLDSITVSVEECAGKLDTAICLGDSLLVEGQVFYPNTMDTIPLMDGSELAVSVSALDTFFFPIDLGVCQGDSINYEGITFQPGQSERFSYTTVTGCDSTIEVTALQLDTFFTIVDTSICAGESLDYNGNVILPGHSQTFSFTAENGCDSTVMINVGKLDTFYTVVDTAVCNGQTFNYYGNSIMPGTTQSFIFTAENGCDSTVMVNVSQLDTVLTILDINTCSGEPYLFNGNELPANSTTPFTFTGTNGCDSTIVVNVNELESIETYDTLQACQGVSIDIFGIPTLEAGIYEETYISAQGCDSTHFIYFVTLDTAELNIPSGQLGCLSNTGSLTVEIDAGDTPYEIEWSNGQTAQTATGLAPGQYSVTVTTAFGCQSVGNGTVTATSPVIGGDVSTQSITCFGENNGAIVVAEPYGGTPPYLYSLDGTNYQSENIFINLAAGEYTLFIKDDERCDTSYTVSIEEPNPVELELPADTTIHSGDSLHILPAILSGNPTEFIWQPPWGIDCPSCQSVISKPSQSVSYTLIARDSSGCEGEDEILIFVDKNVRVYIPNAFSPNGDGINDIFTIYTGPEVLRVNSLQVFSRWGELVYLSEGFLPKQEDIGWDGTFRGEPLDSAVFVYFAEIELVDGRILVSKGEVMLMR